MKKQEALEILQSRVGLASQQRRRPKISVTLDEFVRAEWKPNAALALKKSSMRIYSYQLDKHILPGLGSTSLRDVGRAQIEACLSRLKVKGHATSTLRSIRATFSTVLQAGVERGYLEKNPAHGIRIREADTKKERRFYSPAEIRLLLAVLVGPCRLVVSVAVQTGMRIGEILALRWKRVDLLNGTLEVAETYSDREFGSPKTRSSCRVIPISSILRARTRSAAREGRQCRSGRAWSFKRRAVHRWTQRTCTTGSWRRRAIGSRSRESRGTRSGTRTLRFSATLADLQKQPRLCSGTRIWRPRSTRTHTPFPTRRGPQ